MNLDFDNDEWRDEMLSTYAMKLQFAQSPEERREVWHVIKLLERGRVAAKARREDQAA